MELFDVHDQTSAEDRKLEVSCAERGRKLFGSEDWSEVMQISLGVAGIPLFKVDVLSSSESVGLGSEPPWAESDNHVEVREVFGPSDLSASKNFD